MVGKSGRTPQKTGSFELATVSRARSPTISRTIRSTSAAVVATRTITSARA